MGHEYEEMTRQYVDYMPKKLEKASEAYFQEETHSFAAELNERRVPLMKKYI